MADRRRSSLKIPEPPTLRACPHGNVTIPTREMLISQRTQLLSGLRGHLTEVGVIAPQGLRYAREPAELIEACGD
jgi:hypothetical protein